MDSVLNSEEKCHLTKGLFLNSALFVRKIVYCDAYYISDNCIEIL